MIKWRKIAAAGILWSILLTGAGCGGKTDISQFSENTLAVNKDGSVTELVIESFGEDYYSLEDLKAYVNEQVDAYNASHPAASGKEKDKAVTVDEVAVDNGSAKVVLTYESAGDYEDFNYAQLQIVKAAELSGDSAALSFKDAKGAQVGSLASIEKLENYSAVVSYTAEAIAVSGKIAYVSSNVTLLDEASAKGDGALSVIIYK